VSRARVLVTGFEPFGGEPLNPSGDLARELAGAPHAVPGLELLVRHLPVSRDALPGAADAALDALRPHAIIAVGQATGRPRICLERTAVNRLAYGECVDNEGLAGVDELLETGGPSSLQATLPAEHLARALTDLGHPVEVSDDAGTYLCNALLYRLLRTRPELPALFVHVPLLPSQAERRGKGEPCLSHEQDREALLDLLRLLPGLLPGRDDGVA
jgi:pyroglutamyl-peptidase